MKPGDHLIDSTQGKTPYRVEELIDVGEHHQIAGAYDESRERAVAIRAILYGDESADEEIEYQRAALRRQWAFLEASAETGVAPEPLEWLEVEESPVDRSPEPLIICERVDGKSLYDWIVEDHPRGIEPERALEITGSIADFLSVIHRAKWLWRDFDPRRFFIEDSGAVRAVSIGGVAKRGEPLSAEQLEINDNYVAPEIRDELSGKMQRPPADMYGLGALMSFMLTGEEPRHRVESPLSYPAYERLQELEMPKLELLIARLLQPLAKKRVGRAYKLRKYCSVDDLPTRETKGFEMSMLPAPWLGLEMENPQDNRGLRSKLSSGPLVSIDRKRRVASEEQESPEEAELALDWPMIITVLILVIAAVTIGIILAT